MLLYNICYTENCVREALKYPGNTFMHSYFLVPKCKVPSTRIGSSGFTPHVLAP